MGIGMVHACAAGKQISGQETHERKWQTGVRYAPAKNITYKKNFAFYSRVSK